jgi:hypothetical protein
MLATRPHATRPRSHGTALYALYVSALATTLVANVLIRLGDRGGWLPSAAQTAVAVLGAAPLMVAAVVFWRLLRRDLDEMLPRIVLEGLAFALVLYVPVAALVVNLRTSGAWVPRMDAPELVLAPALLVAIGIEMARRRYQ